MLISGPIGNHEALDATDPYDVCIIGSGPAGTVLGTTLAEAGVKTLIVESGKGMLDWLTNSQLKSLAEYEFSGDTNYPLTRTVSRITGGNSNFWTGRAERFHPSDFEPHPYTPPENPWPIRYSDLESYYEEAERTLRVRGGVLSNYAPPRQDPLPLPARADISSLKKRMKIAGVTLDDSPTATPQKAIRFFRVQEEVLPRFLRSKCGTLVSGVTVTRLRHDENGTITGANAKMLDGSAKTARARVFVVCCGGMQSPRLLLLSRSERFPNGIGNNYDRVGRGFNEHPSINIYGSLRPSLSAYAPRHRIGRTHQFYDLMRNEGLGAIHAVAIQSWVFPNHLIRYRLIDLPKHIGKIAARVVRPTLYMSPTLEMKPSDGNRVTLSSHKRDHFGDPIARLEMSFSKEDLSLIERARELTTSILNSAGATDLEEIELTWSRHHMGACRMGENTQTSVADRNLRVHDCANLYVCGSEVCTTGAAIQPVLTITALAHRLAQHLRKVISDMPSHATST